MVSVGGRRDPSSEALGRLLDVRDKLHRMRLLWGTVVALQYGLGGCLVGALAAYSKGRRESLKFVLLPAIAVIILAIALRARVRYQRISAALLMLDSSLIRHEISRLSVVELDNAVADAKMHIVRPDSASRHPA